MKLIHQRDAEYTENICFYFSYFRVIRGKRISNTTEGINSLLRRRVLGGCKELQTYAFAFIVIPRHIGITT
ncbi:MAG: hypothetical protein D8M58_02945 [Calditrichaeota bacterium]|nr:MAG: hypothetical protein DWQ03_04135 [Calditrichota bacterium]MBL1204322.1 hypothetical protein [Calditrichota bacterium]